MTTYRKGAIDNEEETQNEETCSPSTVGLQLRKTISNGGLIAVVDTGICYQAEEQHTNKEKHSSPPNKANVPCSNLLL